MTVHNTQFFDLASAPMSVETVTLTVRDLNRVTSFYTQMLGLRIYHQTGTTVTLGADNPFLILESDANAALADPRAPGLFHLAFLLPDRKDLSSWLQHAVQQGVKPWGASDHNVSEAIYLSDPEGNGIEVYADRPQSRWFDAQGDIYMPSRRLDLSALPEPQVWTAAPAETRIGHVHLQTTGLQEAETFWTELGMDVMDRYPGATFFGSGGYHHQIAANVWNSRGQPVQTGPKTGLASVTLSVADSITAKPVARKAPSGVDIHLKPKGR